MPSPVSVGAPRRSVRYWVAASTTVVVPALTMTMSAGRWASHYPWTFFESQLSPAALALLLGAATLIPVAVFAGPPRTSLVTGLAVATVGAEVPLWAAWPWLPAEARSATLAASPLVIAGMAATVSHWSGRADRRWLRATYLVVALAVLVHLLGYDPFGDPGCARICEEVSVPLQFLLSTGNAVAVAAVLTVVGAVLASVAVLRSDGPASVVGPGLAALGLAAAMSVTGWSTWGNTTVASWLILLAPVVPGVLAAGICLVAIRTARTRREMSELVASLSLPERSLRVAYAIPGSMRWVDAAGIQAPEHRAGLVLWDESGPALRIELAPGTHRAELLAALTPATRLALRNAQLAAAANARLIDVHASQRRIIATSDGERHRIERDLHDGAQQRLVSALVQLQLVTQPTSAAGRILTETDHQLRAVLSHLRRLDLNPFPETLGSEGLAVALEDLVADSAAPVRLNVSLDQVPDEIGRAVYALAAAMLAWVNDASTTAEVALEVVQHDGRIRLRAEVSGMAEVGQPNLVEATDRIGSVGGWVTITGHTVPGAQSVEAVIPCAS